ncbi:hypothetical protein ACNKHR_12815 [Shigella flexneri]
MERLVVGLYDGMNLDRLEDLSRRYSIWSMVWKRLVLSASRRAARVVVDPVNRCRISR